MKWNLNKMRISKIKIILFKGRLKNWIAQSIDSSLKYCSLRNFSKHLSIPTFYLSSCLLQLDTKPKSIKIIKLNMKM